MIIIEKNARKFCVLKKNAYICNTEKNQLKLTIIEKLKELYPEEYMSGALKEKRKRWEVIWVLS